MISWILLIFCQACERKSAILKPEEISGDYYDWTATMLPEQPWKHDYNKTLVVKIFLCSRDKDGDVEKVHLTFEGALKALQKLDNITLGLPKIAYLVGWQYNGHDSKYPSWDEVNNHLKRDEDSTSLGSLKWLINEAKKYNTTVSLHINMLDAFEDSPLWSEYLEKDIVAKDSTGEPIKGELFNGMQSYQLSYTQEWNLGYAQKRIDGLLEMLPELKENGTIHIDAFHSMRPSGVGKPISPYLGISMEEEISTQRKIFRYWQKKGIDVTSEGGIYWLRKDPFIGLQAMSWHYDEKNYIHDDWLNKPTDFSSLPVLFSGYTPMHAEGEIKKDPENLPGLLERFCLNVVPWYYRRNHDESKHSNVIITDDLVICPVLWMDRGLLAYSKEKDLIDMKFSLPSTWTGIKEIQIFEITLDGLKPISKITIDTSGTFNGILNISIKKNQPVLFKPL